MDRAVFESKAQTYLTELCHKIGNRRVGAAGNRQATRFFADTLARLGFEVETPIFDCIDWEDNGATLMAEGNSFEVFSSPYALGCDIEAPLVIAETVDELAALEAVGESILLLKAEIAQEQVMPKNFPFYNPDHHQKIVSLLEGKAPLAIITATGRNPELAGGMYPFPMLEDGDFDIPSVYMKDVDGDTLEDFAGKPVSLRIDAKRIPATGHNVIARMQPDAEERLVLCAHIDAKDNTPGALDNGTGVVMLMLLAELVRGYEGKYGIELLAFNGEDHYSAQGHKEYLKDHLPRFGEIVLAINTDVAGYVEGHSAFSLYGVPEATAEAIKGVMEKYETLQEGEQWYQSDHSVFIQNGRPAMAITSDQFMALSTNVTHTPKDDLDLVDYAKMVDVALALRDVIEALNKL